MRPARIVYTKPAGMEHYVPGQGGHVLVKAGKEYELPAGREIVQELPLIRRVISTPFNGSSDSDT